MSRLMGRQDGAALVVALLILIVITLLSLSAMRTGSLDVRMATNQQERIEAFQTAQAAVDGVLVYSSNFPVVGGAGYSVCTPNVTDGCNQSTVLLPSQSPFNLAGVVNKVKIIRPDPELGLPPRGMGTSVDKFGSARFVIESEASSGTGRAQLGQGYMILVPLSSQ
jgi:hypothetical protein